MNQPSRAELIRELRERLRHFERSQRRGGEATIATETVLDHLLPDKGLTPGTLLEWLSDGAGAGAATLALAVAARSLRGASLIVIDDRREFYPPAAANLGIALEHLVIVRPGNVRDALWAWEQSLRCRAVAVALGWIDALDERSFRRLQLAAETGGSLGFLLRPSARRAEPTWAEVRLLVSPLTTHHSPLTTHLQSLGRRLRVEVLHCRGGANGAAVELELNDETGDVRLAAPVADSTIARRAAGA